MVTVSTSKTAELFCSKDFTVAIALFMNDEGVMLQCDGVQKRTTLGCWDALLAAVSGMKLSENNSFGLISKAFSLMM